MKKYIDSLHYLTQDNIPGFTMQEQVKTACESGLKWIQFRCFPMDENEWIRQLNIAAEYCDEWGATLIVNDRPDLVLKARDVQGVHIGRSDMDVEQARKMIGPDKVLGVSALTLEDVAYYLKADIDYMSIGPFNHTNTKQINTPPKELKGLEKFIKEIHTRFPDFDIPLIVAGGVELVHLEEILSLDIHGVAVSSAINLSGDPASSMNDFYHKIRACRRIIS